MNRIENIHGKSAYFVFDLEFIGNIQQLTTCKIWEISVFSQSTGQWFTKIVDPAPNTNTFPAPPIPSLPHITRDFLKQHQAQTWDVVLEQLAAWITTQTHCIPVFISHNTFKADKPILELESRRYNCLLPLHWFFFDSLHFCRDVIHSPTGNYSLSGLYQQLFRSSIVNAHRAQYDVVACTAILNSITNDSWRFNGPIYSSYTTSLRTIKWVGKKAEQVLMGASISSVEMLLSLAQNNALNDHLYHRLDSSQSIRKTVQHLMGDQLPVANVKNICDSVYCLYHPSLLSMAITDPALIDRI